MATIEVDEKTGKLITDLETAARQVPDLRESVDSLRRKLSEFMRLLSGDPVAIQKLEELTDGQGSALLLQAFAELSYVEDWTEQLEVANRYDAGEGEEGKAA